MRRNRSAALLLAVGLAATGLFLTSCARTPTDSAGGTRGKQAATINLVLNWTPLADHAPYFVARDRGWYKDAGLDVKIQFGKGSADSASRAATGQADIAVSDTGSVVVAVGKGAKLTIIGMLFDRGPQAVWAKKSSSITRPADLAGKKVGVPTGDTQRVLFPALAQANGFDPAKVTFVNVAPSAKYGALASGQVDAILDFTTGRPFVVKAVGEGNYVELPWRDYGVNLYGNALAANSGWLAQHRDAAKAFLAATYRAWQYTMENPDQALATMKRDVPQIDVATYRTNLDLVLDLFRSQTYAQQGIGWIDHERMCSTVATVEKYIPTPTKPACNSLYTTELLPHVRLPSPLTPATS